MVTRPSTSILFVRAYDVRPCEEEYNTIQVEATQGATASHGINGSSNTEMGKAITRLY